MTFDELKLKAESFFEWPSEDKDHVTTTSALLFARDCVKESLEEVKRLKEAEGLLLDEIIRLTSENAMRDKQDTNNLHWMHYTEGKITGRLEGMKEAVKIAEGHYGLNASGPLTIGEAIRNAMVVRG